VNVKKKKSMKQNLKIVPIFTRIPKDIKFKAHIKAMEEGLTLNEAVALGLQLFIKKKYPSSVYS
jgi:hypothetical protein